MIKIPRKNPIILTFSKGEDTVVKAQNRELDCRVGDCKEDLDGETSLQIFFGFSS